MFLTHRNNYQLITLEMRELTKSALVPYGPEQMFALVADLERYPEFVPWVGQARVIERGPTHVVGELTLQRAGVRERFTTRNTLQAPERIELKLVQGPFRTLEGLWTFQDLAGKGCRVSLRMRFEFANPVLAMLLSKTFEKSCAELVDAFVARARSVYGSKQGPTTG